MSNQVGNMKKTHKVAREKLKTSLRQGKRYCDLRILLRPYSEGDVVYLVDTAVSKGKCKKLGSPWKGPGIIVKKLSAYLYQVKLRNSMFVTHHDRMMPCKDKRFQLGSQRSMHNLLGKHTASGGSERGQG